MGGAQYCDNIGPIFGVQYQAHFLSARMEFAMEMAAQIYYYHYLIGMNFDLL